MYIPYIYLTVGLAVRSIPTKQGLNSNLNNYSPIAQSLPSNINSPNKIMKSRKRGNITFASRQRAYSESDDTMFDLEDFQGNKNCEPFYESDDDSGESLIDVIWFTKFIHFNSFYSGIIF